MSPASIFSALHNIANSTSPANTSFLTFVSQLLSFLPKDLIDSMLSKLQSNLFLALRIASFHT